MGKKDKKQRHQPRAASYYTNGDEEEAGSFSYPQNLPNKEKETDPDDDLEAEEEEVGEEGTDRKKSVSGDTPSKFLLYQQSVQSPKGDISYLQKFFLMYVGGRAPLHLQEDFCGTALLSAEWLRSDSRRTAVGVDFDLEALNWCMENNINKVGADGYSRIFLYHGNVLQPSESKLIKTDPQELISDIQLNECEEDGEADPDSAQDKFEKRNCLPPARDIVCAFNYSCCCLHKRADLILYFKHVLNVLSKKGGIFVMDLYGGSSSELGLRLQRKFPNFTWRQLEEHDNVESDYIEEQLVSAAKFYASVKHHIQHVQYVWEQAEFDIIKRKTRISLHYHLQKPRKKLHHAFSYSWRLWSLPELKDCLEEVGFRSVHFWLRQMPDTESNRRTEGFGAGRDIKYEEVKSFEQQDAWNAYIVAVASRD